MKSQVPLTPSEKLSLLKNDLYHAVSQLKFYMETHVAEPGKWGIYHDLVQEYLEDFEEAADDEKPQVLDLCCSEELEPTEPMEEEEPKRAKKKKRKNRKE